MSNARWDARSPWRRSRRAAPPPPPVAPSTPQLVRVTTARDGTIPNRGYASYSQAWDRGDGTTYVFCGQAGALPQFFAIEGQTVTRLGALVAYPGEAEGWGWTADGAILLCDGPRLRRVGPFIDVRSDDILLDISETHPGCDLWQAHASDDGRTLSATIRQITSDGTTYPKLGTIVHHPTTGRQFLAAQGVLDESTVDASGRYLIIQEDRHNTIHDLVTKEWVTLTQEDGALGHLDVGHGYMVGEDDHHGACTRWELAMPVPPEARRALFSTNNMGHVSVRAGRCLLSGARALSLVDLTTGALTHVVDHGMVVTDPDPRRAYDFQVHANLDPAGRVAVYASNVAGRMDVYLLRL